MFINIEFHLSLCFYSKCFYFCKIKNRLVGFLFLIRKHISCTYMCQIAMWIFYRVQSILGKDGKDIEEYLYLKFHFLFEFLYAE